MRLKGKIALITGSARGIGFKIASLFSSEGASVVLSDVNEQLLETAKGQLRPARGEVFSVKADVTSSQQVEEMIKKTVDKFSKIDILVNNAGITKDNLILRMSEEEWDSVLSVNLKGAFLCTKAVSRIMIKQRYGKIINIASIIGIIGNPGQANYSASKGGLIALTKTSAKELASRNINVNAICPGFIKTDMTARLTTQLQDELLKRIPLGRFGEADDVAKLALFLASQESDYITGCAIKVDGGMAI